MFTKIGAKLEELSRIFEVCEPRRTDPKDDDWTLRPKDWLPLLFPPSAGFFGLLKLFCPREGDSRLGFEDPLLNGIPKVQIEKPDRIKALEDVLKGSVKEQQKGRGERK